jgi:hypothetical protein
VAGGGGQADFPRTVASDGSFQDLSFAFAALLAMFCMMGINVWSKMRKTVVPSSSHSKSRSFAAQHSGSAGDQPRASSDERSVPDPMV